MLKRVISGIILGGFAFAMIYLGGLAMEIFVTVLAAISLFEFYSAFKKKGSKPIIGAGIVMLFILVAGIFASVAKPGKINISPFGFLNVFPVLVLLAVAYILVAIVVRHDKYNIADGAVTAMGGIYVVFLFAYFIYLRNMEAGAYMLLLAIWGCICADTSALIIGCKFGKKKLIPAVSPNKTVAGSIAAFVGSIIGCTGYGIALNLLELFPQFPIYHYVIIGVILGVVSQLGDLGASAIKRYCGVKDFGNIVPGHGGILDRVDSYLLAVPVVYYYYGIFLTLYYFY